MDPCQLRGGGDLTGASTRDGADPNRARKDAIVILLHTISLHEDPGAGHCF